MCVRVQSALSDMERKKEKLMIMSMRRKQQQEETKRIKEEEADQKREKEKEDEERKHRKKEEEKQRREMILERHKIKKAIEEAEKEVRNFSMNIFKFITYFVYLFLCILYIVIFRCGIICINDNFGTFDISF